MTPADISRSCDIARTRRLGAPLWPISKRSSQIRKPPRRSARHSRKPASSRARRSTSSGRSRTSFPCGWIRGRSRTSGLFDRSPVLAFRDPAVHELVTEQSPFRRLIAVAAQDAQVLLDREPASRDGSDMVELALPFRPTDPPVLLRHLAAPAIPFPHALSHRLRDMNSTKTSTLEVLHLLNHRRRTVRNGSRSLGRRRDRG